MTPASERVASRDRHLVLVGLMGVGKTTVGRECALRLERPFVDTDELLLALAGMPFPEFWKAKGEPAFRALERQAVADACDSPEPLVIACGGGAAVDPENRRRLRDAGVVVWLHATTESLLARVGTGDDRPLLVGDPRGALDRLGALRADAYAAAAHAEVDTDDRVVADVADEVIAAFEAAS